MGLVLFAPTEALTPLAGSAAAATTPAQTAAATGDLFASLLASLSATLPTGATAEGQAGDGALALLVPPAETPDEGEKKDPLLACSLMAAPVPVVAGHVTPEATLEAAAGASGVGDVAAAAPEAALAATDAVAIPAEGAAAEATADVSPQAQQPDAAATAGFEQAAAAVTEPAQAAVSPADAAPKPGTGAPPTEADSPQAASANASAADSVVRPVGNAQNEASARDDQAGADHGHGRHEVAAPVRGAGDAPVQPSAHVATPEVRAVHDAARADVPAPASQPQPADVSTPPQVEHVARTVIERVERGGGEARIHLDPAGLGEVTIRVHTQGEHVRIDVHAERPEAMQLLRDHTRDLSALLGDRGLNLADVNVGLGRGNSEQGWNQQQSERNQPTGGEFARIFGGEAPATLDTHHRLRAAYNPDGAMVYRV